MKPRPLLLAAFTAFLVTLAPHPVPASGAHTTTTTSPRSCRHSGDVRRSLRNMESWVTEMRTDNRIGSTAGRSAGNLWMEVNQLKRSGQDVRRIEWCVSELEESLRNKRQDASAQRHIVNDLELEMQLLKQRGR